MQDHEWKQSIAWLMALFPAWRPDALTVATWRTELPAAMSGVDFQTSVRAHKRNHPGPFPPNVFEILAALMGLPLAVVAWATFETADPFVRMAVLVGILVGSVVIMVHGTFSFIKEVD